MLLSVKGKKGIKLYTGQPKLTFEVLGPRLQPFARCFRSQEHIENINAATINQLPVDSKVIELKGLMASQSSVESLKTTQPRSTQLSWRCSRQNMAYAAVVTEATFMATLRGKASLILIISHTIKES